MLGQDPEQGKLEAGESGVGNRTEAGLGRKRGRKEPESDVDTGGGGKGYRGPGAGGWGPENIALYIYIYISHSTHRLTRGQREGRAGREEVVLG